MEHVVDGTAYSAHMYTWHKVYGFSIDFASTAKPIASNIRRVNRSLSRHIDPHEMVATQPSVNRHKGAVQLRAKIPRK